MAESAQAPYVTAIQAAKLLGVNERTVRLWINSGKLLATQPAPNRLAIPLSEVHRKIAEREAAAAGEPGTSPREIAQTLIQLREEIRALEKRMTTIETMLHSSQPVPSTSLAASIPEQLHTNNVHNVNLERPQPTRVRRVEKEPLPPGCILASDFAEQHGVNRITFRDHYLKGKDGEKAAVSERPKRGREQANKGRGETEYYLTPEQQIATLDYWRRHDVPFEEKPVTPPA